MLARIGHLFWNSRLFLRVVRTLLQFRPHHAGVPPLQFQNYLPGLTSQPAPPLAGQEEYPGASFSIALGPYVARLAATPAEIDAACRLRFRVFNIELGEGFASSWHTGLDQDRFDPVCDHLIVEDQLQQQIVGTYRMQTGRNAMLHCGYYSEQEFHFSLYEPLRGQILELGRACIAREHRCSEVLTLLWRGIGQYACTHHLRYLIGCSSLSSNDPAEGWSIYRQLSEFLVPEFLRTQPRKGSELPPDSEPAVRDIKVPRLLRTYLAVGARICGAPAWDQEFRTIDFLTLLDLAQLSPAAKSRFLPGEAPVPVSSEVVPVS